MSLFFCLVWVGLVVFVLWVYLLFVWGFFTLHKQLKLPEEKLWMLLCICGNFVDFVLKEY